MSYMKFDRIILSLIITVLVIYGAPYIPGAVERLDWVVGGLLIVLAVAAAWKKAWVDVGIAVVLLAGLVGGRLKFDQVDSLTYVIRFASVAAFVFLHATLLVGPWSRLVKAWSGMYKHRRHLGVTTFLLGTAHASLVLKSYFQYDFAAAWSSSFVFFGFTTLFIMFWMAVTSWDKVQHAIKNRWWSVIHSALLVVYIGTILYMRSVAVDVASWQLWLLGVFVVFWLLVAPWSLPQLILKRMNGWKQLHVLIYVGYASIIVHAWTGVVKFLELPWLSALLWAMVVMVISSHALGLLVKFFGGKRTKPGDAIDVAGKQYFPTGATDSFVNGKGQRFELPTGPVAVFKNGEKFIAMSAVCPHQGGPIDQGQIVNGFVECPWHHYQYGVEDGRGPAGFKDCIPYFPTTIKDGVVYVAAQDTGGCCMKGGHYEQCA